MASSRESNPVVDYQFERDLATKGYCRVAGIDEAGRGPLAGPVAAAAVVLNPNSIPEGLADSKTLSETRRSELFNEICRSAAVSVAFASAETIDQGNILKASLEAMAKAFAGLPEPADFALVDGRDIPPALVSNGQAVVGGDGKCLSIAAASIVAKVMRDRLMVRCAAAYPQFGFAGHKGYGTAAHRDAIGMHGPCPLHRMSFAPLRKSD